METRAHYVLIGAAVLAALALSFLFVLWLGPSRVNYDLYDIRFTDRVSGLTVGAPVRFNGVQKGEVRRLTISQEDPSVVVARIRVEDDTPVKPDTKAELELVGFTGLAVIQLVGGSPQAPLLKETLRGVPVIDGTAPSFGALLEGGGDIVAAANRLLSEENTEAFARIMSSLDITLAAVAENEDDIRLAIANVAEISSDLAAASDKLAAAADGLETLMNDDAPGTLAEAEAAAKELRVLLADLDSVIEENRDALALFAEQGLTQVGPAFTEARRAFRTLDEVLREIDRDPRGYLLGESTPRHNTDEG